MGKAVRPPSVRGSPRGLLQGDERTLHEALIRAQYDREVFEDKRSGEPLEKEAESLSSADTFMSMLVGQRVVERGKVITAAGVSAGIDMALTLLARLHGPQIAQGLQLAIEYDPQSRGAEAYIKLAKELITRAEKRQAAAAQVQEKVAAAARHVGVTRPKLYRLLWAQGIKPESFRIL